MWFGADPDHNVDVVEERKHLASEEEEPADLTGSAAAAAAAERRVFTVWLLQHLLI